MQLTRIYPGGSSKTVTTNFKEIKNILNNSPESSVPSCSSPEGIPSSQQTQQIIKSGCMNNTADRKKCAGCARTEEKLFQKRAGVEQRAEIS